VSTDDLKRDAAERAAALVTDGMRIGLGTGSTAAHLVTCLGKRVREGLVVVGVPTSEATRGQAAREGIPLTTLDDMPELDLTIDGADEVDPHLNCIKGRGGALLREKIVARAAARFVVIVDENKRVSRLGKSAPLPVEIIPFGWTSTRTRLEVLGLTCELRGGETPYQTANGNYILDCHVPASVDLAAGPLDTSIKVQTGVVDHGLFLGMATAVVVGKKSGGVEVLHRPPKGY
jgi:ribose 5-phosphate isomerase A